MAADRSCSRMALNSTALPQCSLVPLPVPTSLGSTIFLTSGGRALVKKRASVVLCKAEKESTSGTQKLSKLPGTFKVRKKDDDLVFVAGATGRVGTRTVRELLKLGLKVKAGVRSVEKFQTLLGDIMDAKPAPKPLFFLNPAKLFSFFGSQKQEDVQVVECNLENPEEIEEAIGNCGVVICTIGASESEVLDVKGPYRVDYLATKNLIDAAKSANVNHFVLLTSLGTTKLGWPAAVLNLFWGVLIWKAKAEKALIDSGLTYTIVRPGGMERPTDTYKETHNLRLGPKDSFFGGQVSRLQIAELLACIAKNLELAEDKVVEAIAETTAPLRPIEDLLAELPSDLSTSDDEDADEDALEKKDNDAAKAKEARALEEAKQKEAEAKKQEAESKKQEAEAKKQEAEVRKQEAEAKKREAEARKMEDLRGKFEAEYQKLRENEKLALEEAEMLQMKKAKIDEEAAEAAETAARAKALANAIVDAAKKGQLLSKEEKQKLLNAPLLTAGSAKTEIKTKPIIKPKETPPKPAVTKATEAPATVLEAMKPPSVPVPEDPKPKSIKTPEKVKETPKLSKEVEPVAALEEDPASTSPKETDPKQTAPFEVPVEDSASNGSKEFEPLATTKDVPVSAADPASNGPISSRQTVTQEDTKEEAKEMEQVKDEAPKRKPFPWFWQPDAESEPEPGSQPETSPEPRVEPKETIPIAYTSPTLSPYARYEDFKPPSSPMPKPPSVKEPKPTQLEEPVASPVSAPPTKADDTKEAEAIKNREEEALKKAKSVNVFSWPWKVPEPEVEPEPAENEASSIQSEKVEVPVQPEKAEVKSESIVPDNTTSPAPVVLSPYTRYPDLKPPSSPTPTPPKVESKAKEQVNSSPVPVSEMQAEDSQAKADSEAEMQLAYIQEREEEALKKAKSANAFTWPWKPTEVAVEQEPFAAVEGANSETVMPESSTLSQPPLDVLSPYTRYPDLKPPSSPTPTPPKVETKMTDEPVASANVSETKKPVLEEPVPGDETEPIVTQPPLPSKNVSGGVQDANERAAEALAKARAALKWPW